MKNITLIIFMAVFALCAGCSKDDMVNHEQTAAASKVNSKAGVKCTDLGLISAECVSSSGKINSAVTFTWNNANLNYVFNRVYKSYIQIESNGCPNTNSSPVNIPIHLFTTSTYTLPEGYSETCFKYRIVVLGYDRGQMACESMSHWKEFSYTEHSVPVQ